MKILLAQLNNIVGDIKGNTSKALEILNKAKEESIDLVVFSELFLSGYPPEDLVLKRSFIKKCRISLDELTEFTNKKNLGFLIGLPILEDSNLYNAVQAFNTTLGRQV